MKSFNGLDQSSREASRLFPRRVGKPCLNDVRESSSGSLMMTCALLLPILLLMTGFAVDYSAASWQKRKLQQASDAAALAAAREMSLINSDDAQILAVVDATARANLMGDDKDLTVDANITRPTDFNADKMMVDSSADQNVSSAPTITVKISQLPQNMFFTGASFFNGPIVVESVAQIVGKTPVCVIGLDTSSQDTIMLDSNAKLTGRECAVFSNSTSTRGMRAISSSILTANLICSSGGTSGGASNFDPEPLSDCPAVDDPLQHRQLPMGIGSGTCSENNLSIVDETRTLAPGIFCGGLKIDGNAKVNLEPGIYVIQDGSLVVDSNAELYGKYVSFYFTGKNAVFRFTSNAVVNLSAPKDGPLAGLLFFESPDSDELLNYTIESNYTRELLGTIYLPKGRLIVDADSPVADQSAYTAIIVRRMRLLSSPNLVLNTNYDATDVPVPEGIGGSGTNVRLAR